ncbi:efflux RND transporter permease subunit [bacterium]|nr:efflux RND transporter permease subunit [Akkermansiaceae bacterium]MDB4464715.1 efflux RND transporter permease subunit [Akkermansiaceae bacterium]MDB4488303.1 efflux RND transporter permease subunit [bacterium]
MIRWFAKNDIASNLLMLAIVLAGLYTAFNKIPLEVQPSYDIGEVEINMRFRGASPQDVQEHIVKPIERALRDLPGVKLIDSKARSGSANIDVEAEDGVDLRELRDEVEARVGAINTFPGETERPEIHIPNMSNYREVLTIAITGELSENDLYKTARRVENELLDLPEISRTDMRGTQPLEISIEADDQKLRDYGLSFEDLVNAIRRSSLALSAGSLRTPVGSIMIRTDGQAYTQEDFSNIVVTAQDGAQIQVGDLAYIKDGFEDAQMMTRFNGEPAIMIDILRAADENAIEISDAVQRYIENTSPLLPNGVSLSAWDDESIRIRGRLSTLGNSLIMGAGLVLLVLGLFLRPMLAFWVVLGIPISFAGGVLLMPYFGMTANTMSIFAFIIVLGIVVDDAIVTGENIYTKLRENLTPLDAAVIGTKEVATPVTFGAITTIVAFIPLSYFPGFWSAWTSQIPPIVASVLVFSLIESKLILPSHLKHLSTNRRKMGGFARFQKWVADSLERAIEKFYRPVLALASKYRYTTIALFFALAMAGFGYHKSGEIGFVDMPKVERYRISAYLSMIDNTPFEETDSQISHIAACAEEMKRELIDPGTGESLVRNIMTSTGASRWGGAGDPEQGFASLEIMPPSERSEPGPTNAEIAKMWEEKIGEIENVRYLRVSGEWGSRSRGQEELNSLSVELRGEDSEEKRAIAEEIELLFEAQEGIQGAHADNQRQREEFAITLKPRALELGITQRALAQQIRQAFYGEEAQRLQRDGEEIRVMVRLPKEKRESMFTFENLTIQAPNGSIIPFSTVATASLQEAPGTIESLNGAQVSYINAQPKNQEVKIMEMAERLSPQISEIVAKSSDLSWIWAGYIKEQRETSSRYTWLYGLLILTLYGLLAIPFKSLLQPFIVLLAVPFGVIGAYAGHILLDITPSYLSVFGIMALTGVVVNDSLVLVDFINQKRREGMDLHEAVRISGVRRFRPIFLTSITTFAGLMPLMFDRAIHAQFLKPMAVSLGFGILFATIITLFLIPTAYLALEDLKALFRPLWRWYAKPFKDEEEPEISAAREI